MTDEEKRQQNQRRWAQAMKQQRCPFTPDGYCLGVNCQFAKDYDCRLASIAFVLDTMLDALWDCEEDQTPRKPMPIFPLPVQVVGDGPMTYLCDVCGERFTWKTCPEGESVCDGGFTCSDECRQSIPKHAAPSDDGDTPATEVPA